MIKVYLYSIGLLCFFVVWAYLFSYFFGGDVDHIFIGCMAFFCVIDFFHRNLNEKKSDSIKNVPYSDGSPSREWE